MRDIKFRAWIKAEKRMITDTQDFIPLIVTNKGILKLSPTHEENLYFFINDIDIELMQYTGLHDKTGKEAYDFDICVMDERQSKWIIYPVKCGSCICTIDEWNQSNGHPFLTNALSEIQNEQHFEESSTIIGNIFEKPKLVESVEE